MKLATIPGDIIATGTPGGVGAGRKPPRFLAGGELLTTRSEGIGELANRVIKEVVKEKDAAP